MNITWTHFTPLLPEIFVLVMACIAIGLCLFLPMAKHKNFIYGWAQITLIGGAVLTVWLSHLAPVYLVANTYVFDEIAVVLKLAIYSISFFVFLFSKDYVYQRIKPYAEYYILALFSVLGMLVLVSAHNFVIVYVGLELLSLPLYAMIALRRDVAINNEASLKYFVMGALASGILLYGLSLLYGATGTLAIQQTAVAIANLSVESNQLLVFGLVFIVAGVVFKFGGAPFHMWVPDVYSGAPTATTLFLSTAPKIAAFALAYRILAEALPVLSPNWGQFLLIVILLSLAIGNIAAIMQSNIKRMLAYSSIAHMGYMLLGFLAASEAGYAAATYYIITYSIMALGAFAVLVMLSQQGIEVQNITDLSGLNKSHPWLAFLMLVLLFSMAGVPPTVGFIAKLAVLEAVLAEGLVWLVIAALLFAVIGAYYYIRVVKVMYFSEETFLDYKPLPLDATVAISIVGLSVLLLGIVPNVLMVPVYGVFS